MNSRLNLPDKSRIARSFGKAAGSYDSNAHFQRDIADRLLSRLAGNTPHSILDVGSGTGYCAGKLGELFPEAAITSLDIAEPMLLHARQSVQGDRENWVCADAESLPFKDRSFDLVVSSLTLQWCPQPDNMFREIFRVLNPGGQALVSTLAYNTLAELRACWASVDAYVHVNNFLPVAAIREAAAAAPFASATCDHSTQHYYYASLKALARELKGIGAHNLNSGQPGGLTGKHKLAKLNAAFESRQIPGQGIPVTYDAVMLSLVK